MPDKKNNGLPKRSSPWFLGALVLGYKFKDMKLTIFFIAFAFLFALINAPISRAQNNPYPNELEGYDFFGNGKLKDLKLGFSTKENVKKIFGKKCDSSCDYDTDWTINFSYYENAWTKEDIDQKNKKIVYYLDSKYLGKLRKIEIRPKKQVSLGNVSFPNAFQKLSRSSITNDTRIRKKRMITYELFQDSYGLVYELFDRADYDDIKLKGEKFYNKGDLFSIQYNVSKEQEKEMFILQKK